MQLNRIIQPEIRIIDKIDIAPISSHKFSNGVPLYYLNRGDQDVARIDIMVRAGKWEQPKNLVASFTNLLLKEGAGKLDSKTIAEQLDFYGAWLQLADTYHYSYLTLYTPNRFFRETVSLLELMLKSPNFPESEFKTAVERRRQQYLVEQEKVRTLALQAFTNALFGDNHPYGMLLDADDFYRLSPDDPAAYYKKHYHSANTSIVISGKISDEMMLFMEETFGRHSWGQAGVGNVPEYPVDPGKNLSVFVEKAGAMQNGVRMGLQTINRSHPDFNALRIANTILGGYFGSRLMSNIREDKGYTYGISSGITSLKQAAYLTITTQTAYEYTRPLIAEVFSEIERLQQELVGEKELEMVRNYMLGDFVRSLDGVFSLADIYISLLASDLPFNFYHNQVESIRQITSEEIRRMAQLYFAKEKMYRVVAGNITES